MSVTVEEFRAYVNTDEVSDFVTECLASGLAMVESYIGEITTVPAVIKDQATLLCASEFFHRRSAPQGVAQFAALDGVQAPRISRDPMVAVRPLLDRFVGWAV